MNRTCSPGRGANDGISCACIGELLYDATVHFTRITEYGLSLTAFLSSQAAPPSAGARIDVAFEGSISGPKLKGHASGVDYVYIRADGQVKLHIHAEITTDDGEKIAFLADGVASPEQGSSLLQIRESVTLTTSSPAYAWVNRVVGWGQGAVDPAKGEVRVKVYAV